MWLADINSAERVDMLIGIPLQQLYRIVCDCLGKYFGAHVEADIEDLEPLLEQSAIGPGIWRAKSCSDM